MTVPYFIFHNVSTQRAVGTSAASGLPIAVVGAMGYAATGLDADLLPPGTFGYLYLPAFAAIVALSIPTAKVGAAVASRLDPVWLKRAFALFLSSIGTLLVFGA